MIPYFEKPPHSDHEWFKKTQRTTNSYWEEKYISLKMLWYWCVQHGFYHEVPTKTLLPLVQRISSGPLFAESVTRLMCHSTGNIISVYLSSETNFAYIFVNLFQSAIPLGGVIFRIHFVEHSTDHHPPSGLLHQGQWGSQRLMTGPDRKQQT